jgi:hypothetical protein
MPWSCRYGGSCRFLAGKDEAKMVPRNIYRGRTYPARAALVFGRSFSLWHIGGATVSKLLYKMHGFPNFIHSFPVST